MVVVVMAPGTRAGRPPRLVGGREEERERGGDEGRPLLRILLWLELLKGHLSEK